jgi:CTP:molybdopterin cytidylyltransferase MocA
VAHLGQYEVVHGLLLAAGSGTRMGVPKALVREGNGEPWLTRALEVLQGGGCESVTIVLGAAADSALGLLCGHRVATVVASDWAIGISASLRAGLEALNPTNARSALVHLVDLPDVTAAVARRVAGAGDHPEVLARAAYGGRPGHPVLIGRDHWPGVMAVADGDHGAREYLVEHRATVVECGDLATGVDGDSRYARRCPRHLLRCTVTCNAGSEGPRLWGCSAPASADASGMRASRCSAP